MLKRPYFIGIAGASCSGKTSVAVYLAENLTLGDAVIVGLDSYYYDLSSLPPEEIHQYNLDEPAALDEDLLFANMHALADGGIIEKPRYDHKTHSRHEKPEIIEAMDFVVIEGLFTLHWPELRRLLHTSVFIDASDSVCLERRTRRDRTLRGRSAEEVRERYEKMVKPMFDRWVLPTRQYADTHINGHDPLHRSVATILQNIQKNLEQ